MLLSVASSYFAEPNLEDVLPKALQDILLENANVAET